MDEKLFAMKQELMQQFVFEVYRKRPDIKCIVHSHPMHVSALAMTGRNLEPEHMDFMAFYEEVQYLDEWPGVPFGDLEGELISGLLGENHWSGLLANHGLIVGGNWKINLIFSFNWAEEF